MNTRKTDYGIDAPGVIRNLSLCGIALCVIAVFTPALKLGALVIDTSGLVWSGIALLAGAVLMLTYSLYGKFRHRDKMLDMIQWTGNEHVLDIGTGKGLLLIGAAKRLTTGKAIGVDIWNAEDLSGNALAGALQNADLAGVRDKIEILNEDATQLSFADDSFDVILTNMCLHNIYSKDGRNTACREIVRVLKKGGTAIISDFRHMREYREYFVGLGITTQYINANFLKSFPAVSMVVLHK